MCRSNYLGCTIDLVCNLIQTARCYSKKLLCLLIHEKQRAANDLLHWKFINHLSPPSLSWPLTESRFHLTHVQCRLDDIYVGCEVLGWKLMLHWLFLLPKTQKSCCYCFVLFTRHQLKVQLR